MAAPYVRGSLLAVVNELPGLLTARDARVNQQFKDQLDAMMVELNAINTNVDSLTARKAMADGEVARLTRELAAANNNGDRARLEQQLQEALTRKTELETELGEAYPRLIQFRDALRQNGANQDVAPINDLLRTILQKVPAPREPRINGLFGGSNKYKKSMKRRKSKKSKKYKNYKKKSKRK